MHSVKRSLVLILVLLPALLVFTHSSNDGSPKQSGNPAPGAVVGPLDSKQRPKANPPPTLQQPLPLKGTSPVDTFTAGSGLTSHTNPHSAEIETALDLIQGSEDLPIELALEQLQPLFYHRQVQVRLAAYQALADFRHPQRLAILSVALTDPQPEIRILALDALATPATQVEALSHIELGLTDSAATVRIAAIDALAEFSAARVVNRLGAVLFDPEAEVRRHAVAVLGEVGGDEAVGYLLQARHDTDRNTRASAQSILRELKIGARPQAQD